jgi:hypothetical protein
MRLRDWIVRLFMKKTIKDLDVTKIAECHLITLEPGGIFYKKSKDDPLNFHYNQTTFTTAVPIETVNPIYIGTNSGSTCLVEAVTILRAETIGRDGMVYEIKVVKDIDRFVDLDKVCEEQEIEREYLKIYPDGPYQRNPQEESELFNLYGLEIGNRRVHGVRYRSRRDPTGHCIIIYDTLPDLRERATTRDITDEHKLFNI